MCNQGRNQVFIEGVNINLSINTFMQNFKIVKKCIANF